ncbi:MAG TPA: hypothetical protein VK675_04310, partial [Candidatus Paceibacterota bacterium]|nr:hypothetical protein [Candidatus Paceibacterota bacterium]
ITATTATGNGTITATGGANATTRGVVYGTTTSYGSTTTESGSFATVAFTASITSLTCNTLYHYASYAINTGGTSYGSDQTFTTGSCVVIPTVTTSAASSVAATTMTLNAGISSNGGGSITQSGFDYSTSSDLSTGVTTTTLGAQAGSTFSGGVTGLTSGTLYYFRAYAVNSAGTGYGAIVSTTTAFDADVLDWIARVQGQGSDVTVAGTKVAVNNFVAGLKADGVWSKIVRMNIYAGDGLNALKAPLKNGGPSATDVLNNFVSGDYNQSTGLTGTLSGSKYLNPGISYDSPLMGDSDIHISLYVRTAPDSGITMQGYGPPAAGLYVSTSGTTAFWTNSNVSGISFADTNGIGFYIGSRSSSTSSVLYKNGVSQASTTSAGGSRPGFPMYLYCQYYTGFGGPNATTGRTMEMYSFGTGLTATDAVNFTNRYATLRTALGR